jgi:hypothetical protein
MSFAPAQKWTGRNLSRLRTEPRESKSRGRTGFSKHRSRPPDAGLLGRLCGGGIDAAYDHFCAPPRLLESGGSRSLLATAFSERASARA